MKALPIEQTRIRYGEGRFAEIAIWQLPAPLTGSAHGYKYRLAYVVNDACVLRYDNETGKGDHKHVGKVEKAYTFTTVAQLLADFSADITRWNDGHDTV